MENEQHDDRPYNDDPLRIVWKFIDASLPLNAAEQKKYERYISKFPPEEQQAIRERTAVWQRKDREEAVIRQIRSRVGSVTQETKQRLDALPDEQLAELSEALRDLTKPADLASWLSIQTAQ